MSNISKYISIIPINVNGLSLPIKRSGLAQWNKKQNPTMCYIQETHLIHKEIHRLKVKGWKTILHASASEKKIETTILFSVSTSN